MSIETQQLFEQTLVGDYEDEQAWKAVHALRMRAGGEVFDVAASWLGADEPLKRARGAAILGQLREQEPKVYEECFAYLSKLLDSESKPLVLASAISALGHLRIDAAIPVISRYVIHPDHKVRFAAAFAFGSFANDPLAVSGLLQLTRDVDSDVRDWAVFGLGVLGSTDTPEIRDALFACLSDGDEDVREEAATGLGKRQDIRLLPALRRMLDDPELHIRVAEAAAALLGLEKDPPDWKADNYRLALTQEFGLG